MILEVKNYMEKKSSNTFCNGLIVLMIIFMIAGVGFLAAGAIAIPVNILLILCAFGCWTISGILLLTHTLACR